MSPNLPFQGREGKCPMFQLYYNASKLEPLYSSSRLESAKKDFISPRCSTWELELSWLVWKCIANKAHSLFSSNWFMSLLFMGLPHYVSLPWLLHCLRVHSGSTSKLINQSKIINQQDQISGNWHFLITFVLIYYVGFLHSCHFHYYMWQHNKPQIKMINKSLCKFHSHFIGHATLEF